MSKLNKNSYNTHSNITSLSKKVLISVALILIFSNDYLNFVNSCYITNCPWGGKRAYSDEAPRQVFIFIKVKLIELASTNRFCK